jgi:BirA family biotin operon repressor/biotin-[acetyl-CoA-carboxylase] ligase
LALEFARKGAQEGTVVAAAYQTHGRGRFERRWLSPREKGLLFSVVLRPRMPASVVSILTHLSAVSVRETLVTRFRLSAKLKRPNDILVNGRKIAGILTEASGNKGGMDYAVVGIGLNVNSRSKELPPMATSIYQETGKKADLKMLLTDILSCFQGKYEDYINEGRIARV